MASFTQWTRLEPQDGRGDPGPALQARLYDPLWLLARQWQMGEFQGEDAGSPANARIRLERFPLSRYHPGPLPEAGQVQAQTYDPARQPLEALVEARPVRSIAGPQKDLALASEAGLHFLRLLEINDQSGRISDYMAEYPLPELSPEMLEVLDLRSRRRLSLLANSALDGARLFADLQASLESAGDGELGLPDRPEIQPGDQEAVTAAAHEYLDWYRRLYCEPPPGAQAWQPERMEYSLAVSAAGPTRELTLVAQEYSRGRLDWYSFDLDTGASLGVGDAPAEALVRTVIPTPVSYPGMPASRWWEFEDARVNFGRVDATPDDILRMAFTGFALLYSDDWFLAPVEVEAGALLHPRSLVVTDTFGQRFLIRHYRQIDAPGEDWRLFSLESLPAATFASNAANAMNDELLFLPPVLPAGLQSAPVEEVLLARDELANLAWAIEQRVPGPAGRAIDRYEGDVRRRSASLPTQPEPDGASGTDWNYLLATSVPSYWLPLMPFRPDPDRPDIRLRLGKVLLDQDGEPVLPAPLGRILEPGRTLSLFEEEVPRSGVRLREAWQFVRWVDGSTWVWRGRSKDPGGGQASSGLRFDQIEVGQE
jgi:hypothetical protein